MHLMVMTPTRILVDEDVKKVSAKGGGGAFTLLPRHQDITAVLTPGLLSFIDAADREVFTAVDEGLIVKTGADVNVSTRQAVRSDDLEHLHEVVEKEFMVLDEREKKARTAAARIEAGFVRKFLDLNKNA